MNNDPSSTEQNPEHERALLQEEVAELRAVQMMYSHTQEGFEALEQQLARIIHSAMDGIITIDDEHHIVLFNAAAEEIFQCSASDVLGKPLDQFIAEPMRQVHREHLRRFAESGETYRRMGTYREISGLRYTGEPSFSASASVLRILDSRLLRAKANMTTLPIMDITAMMIAAVLSVNVNSYVAGFFALDKPLHG